MEGVVQNSKMGRVKSSLNVSVSQMDKENHHLSRHLGGGDSLSPSPLLRYLRSTTGSPPLPLSSLDNFDPQLELALSIARSPTLYTTPIKVEEDVLVMDGILLPTERFSRSSSSSATDSSSSSGGKSLYKTDICRSWEDFGICRYGFKCQFAHGKEELRPSRFCGRNKSDVNNMRSKTRFLHPHHQVMGMPVTASPTKPPTSYNNMYTTTSINITSTNWSPLDDGIEVVLPRSSTPLQKDVNAYIHGVLYGSTTTKRRLPVFAGICSD